jgi:hypothetical protein
MNFKRPYWLLFFISLGCVVLPWAGMMIFYTGEEWLLGFCSSILMMLGVVGFVASLIWMMVVGIISAVRSHQPKH